MTRIDIQAIRDAHKYEAGRKTLGVFHRHKRKDKFKYNWRTSFLEIAGTLATCSGFSTLAYFAVTSTANGGVVYIVLTAIVCAAALLMGRAFVRALITGADKPVDINRKQKIIDTLKTPRLYPDGSVQFDYERIDISKSTPEYIHIDRDYAAKEINGHKSRYDIPMDVREACDAYVKNEAPDDAFILNLLGNQIQDMESRYTGNLERELKKIYEKSGDKTATPLITSLTERKQQIDEQIRNYNDDMVNHAETLKKIQIERIESK